MEKFEKIYQELRKRLTEEEIADGFLIPQDLTEEEWAEANRQMRERRFKRLAEMTDEQKIMADIIRLRCHIEDYLEKSRFDKEKTFAFYLKEYIRVTRKSQKQIAEDLGIHYTKLSRLLNDKDDPNIAIAYRLQTHSDDLIGAVSWWKLLVKKQEYLISQDSEKRREEAAKVRNPMKSSA